MEQEFGNGEDNYLELAAIGSHISSRKKPTIIHITRKLDMHIIMCNTEYIKCNSRNTNNRIE